MLASAPARSTAAAKRRPPILAREPAPPALWMRPVLWMQRLMTSKLKLHRRGMHIEVKLVDPRAKRRANPEDKAQRASAADQAALDAMRKDLATLLRQHQSSRAVLRHLAHVEHALGQMGLRCFKRLPVSVLSGARRQLEVLVSDWTVRGLADLRSRLAIACADRADEPVNDEDTPPNALFGKGHLEVSEASDSVFQEFHAEWSATAPLDPAMVAAAIAERDAIQTAKHAQAA